MSRRAARFAAWATAVVGVASGAVAARLAIPHPHALAGAWTLLHLTALTSLLATTPRDAIRLPSLLSEVLVLAGAPLLLRAAAGGAGPAVLLAAALIVVNHAAAHRPFIRAVPSLGNPWRLAPSLWHPALWLVASRPPGSARAWLGVALVPVAQAASVLTRSPSVTVRRVGWTVWAACAIATIVALA